MVSTRRHHLAISSLIADDRGWIIVYATFAMIVMLGFIGVVVDLGYGAVKHRLAQNAADGAALAAAEKILLGGDQASATTSAQLVAQKNGYAASTLTLTFLDSAQNPTSDAGLTYYVRAAISSTYPTLFLRSLGIPTATVSATAASGVGGGASPCGLCVLNPSASGALSANGNGTVRVSGSGIVVNSTSPTAAVTIGNAVIVDPWIGVVGWYSQAKSGEFNPLPTRINPIPDPLASIPTPVFTNYLARNSITVTNNQSATAQPGIYDTISASSKGTVTLQPGEYIITGKVVTQGNGVIVGNGVMLYFTCGTWPTPAACSPNQSGGFLSLAGNGAWMLTGETSGKWKGVTVFYDRRNKAPMTITGNGKETLTGTIYGKSSALTLQGNGATDTFQSMIVADTVSAGGNGTLTLNDGTQVNYPRIGLAGIVN